MIECKLISRDNKTVVIEHSKKRYSIESCSDCPFIDWSGAASCDMTEEVFYTDEFNEFGNKCPFFVHEVGSQIGSQL